VYLLPKVREAKDTIGWEARAQFKGAPLAGSLKVCIDLHWPDRRKHDIDNIKVLLDALSGIVWDDDGQIVDLHIRKHYDKEQPRVELEVSPC